ncbi:hypothetical protein MTO96_023305 [Rhipicephalus appendiculatus]
MDIALRQINLSLLYTLACDTSVTSEVQVKRFQCLLNNIDPADKMVVLGCQYNVGGTMDAATFPHRTVREQAAVHKGELM